MGQAAAMFDTRDTVWWTCEGCEENGGVSSAAHDVRCESSSAAAGNFVPSRMSARHSNQSRPLQRAAEPVLRAASNRGERKKRDHDQAILPKAEAC